MGFFNQWIVLRCPFIVVGGQRRFVRRDEIRRGTKAVLRHCGLRPRRKRPCRRAADQRDELSSLHYQHPSVCFKNFSKPNLHRPSTTLVACKPSRPQISASAVLLNGTPRDSGPRQGWHPIA